MAPTTTALTIPEAPGPRTLAIDVGGTGTKLLVLDDDGVPLAPRQRRRTPRPASPRALLRLIEEMIATQLPFDRVSVGFPGVVLHGVVRTAPNLGSPLWHGFDLQDAIEELTESPARVVNDADMQGYGVISGEGVELVLTLGTGLGTALFTSGHLVPNLELGHHPFERDQTYEERVGRRALRRIGKRRWRRRILRVVAELERTWNFDALYIGGGNARYLSDALPRRVRVFGSIQGLAGGARLWRDDPVPLGAESWLDFEQRRRSRPPGPPLAAANVDPPVELDPDQSKKVAPMFTDG